MDFIPCSESYRTKPFKKKKYSLVVPLTSIKKLSVNTTAYQVTILKALLHYFQPQQDTICVKDSQQSGETAAATFRNSKIGKNQFVMRVLVTETKSGKTKSKLALPSGGSGVSRSVPLHTYYVHIGYD
jgi:hypothetical protein